jgi:hypothetical protein
MLGKHTLAPNEKTEIKVSYDTEMRPGPFEKHVSLTTNIPGHEEINIFVFRGDVEEAPGAKIAVVPRRVVLEGAERNTGKKQAFSITNEGSLPLVITDIRSKDGKTIYFDGSKTGNITIEPDQTKIRELQLPGIDGDQEKGEYILIRSNARNNGDSGLHIMIQYPAFDMKK